MRMGTNERPFRGGKFAITRAGIASPQSLYTSLTTPRTTHHYAICTPKRLINHFRIFPLPDHSSPVTLRSDLNNNVLRAPRKKQIPSNQFHKNMKNTRILSLAIAWSIVMMATAPGHDWHRHDSEPTGPFSVPAAEGAEPANSAAAAERAEAFAPFHPSVRVRWDDTWFYIESNGIADHEMMTGITNWQQQIPVPQYYYGLNAWQIPLNPTPAAAATPVSSTNLLRGAYAIAVNGIPISNLYNDSGENTTEIGELDQWGGHCDQADDYHYHMVPHHLTSTVGETAPLAFALDGYPIYGSTEPDGSVQSIALDSNMGHSHGEHDYHYHALEAADYSITGLYGEVTVSAGEPENQIEPQPSTSEFRPALTSLSGASITAFSRPDEDAFSLTYQLNGQDYMVNWSLDRNLGSVTYQYVEPDGTSTSETYTNWQPGPESIIPAVTLTDHGNSLFQFDISGTPEISYPFSWSTDLANWERFGFLQLDSLGQASFSLNHPMP